MLDKTIEDLVNEHVIFHGAVAKGWNKVYCEVCGDGSRTKGPRGGWLFNGEMCFYHCFNCGIDGNFDPNREHPFSKDMIKIFDAFNIPSKEYYAIAYAKKVLEGGTKAKKPINAVNNVAVLEIPDYFYLLQDASEENIIANKAKEELKYRNIDINSYPFFLSNGMSKKGPREEAIAKSLMNRLIIPIFNQNEELIYYQARALDKDSKKKYINPDTPRSNIVYGMDQIYSNANTPLYITEGFFDAFHLKGVALLENNITSQQIALLNKSRRKKIFVPDKNSDSSKIVDACIKLGWAVSVPDIGNSCKDIDDAIRKYGKLYTLQQVASNVYDNAEDAKVIMKLSGYLT